MSQRHPPDQDLHSGGDSATEPRPRGSGAKRPRLHKPQKIPHQIGPILRTHGLRMKLHSPYRSGRVPQRHHGSVARPGNLPNFRGQRLHHGKRVISDGGKPHGNPPEQLVPVMNDFARITMHRRGCHHLAAECGCDSLMSEANAQNGHGGVPDHVARDAEIALALRAPRTRRNDHATECKVANLLPRHLVVTDYNRCFPADDGHQADKVERKRIVVIDDEDGQWV